MKHQKHAVINKVCHSRKFLSGIYNARRYKTKENSLLNECVEDPRVLRTAKSGMTTYLMSGLHLTYKDVLNKSYRLGVSPTGDAGKPENIRCKAGKLSGLRLTYKGCRAFTLIELLVVVLIIGILAAVAVPQYQRAVLKARFTQAKVMVNALAKAEEVYYLANGSYSPSISALDIDTPEALEEDVQTNSDSRTFSWGSCWIALNEYGDRIVCFLNNEIKLYKYLQHSTQYPNEYQCRAENTDLNSPQNKLCKQESGKDSPRGCNDSEGNCTW